MFIAECYWHIFYWRSQHRKCLNYWCKCVVRLSITCLFYSRVCQFARWTILPVAHICWPTILCWQRWWRTAHWRPHGLNFAIHLQSLQYCCSPSNLLPPDTTHCYVTIFANDVFWLLFSILGHLLLHTERLCLSAHIEDSIQNTSTSLPISYLFAIHSQNVIEHQAAHTHNTRATDSKYRTGRRIDTEGKTQYKCETYEAESLNLK